MKRPIHIENYDEELSHLINPPIVDDLLAREAAEAAKSQVERIKLEAKRRPLALSWDDCRVQRIMGVGGYGAVSLVRVSKLDDIAQQTHWYALKCVRRNVLLKDDSCNTVDRESFVKAVEDIYKEAAILSRLRHKNIVQIHGILKENAEKTFQEPGGYFLVLQCMKRRLDDLLFKTWQKGNKPVPSVKERIFKVALGISDGMKYLHENRILYRDLKSSNVGIDYNGNPRILDFGTAVVLENGKESVHGCIGSMSYMAPEVLIQHKSYFASDVYSFAILLWQIISLRKPYEEQKSFDYKQMKNKVGKLGMRPSPMPENIDMELTELLHDCWDSDHVYRPTFKSISTTLRQMETPSQTVSLSSGNDDSTISRLRRFFSITKNFRGHSRHRVI